MTFAPPSSSSRPYTNPVWSGDFGDPFILSHAAGYVAFGTGPVRDGRAIPTLLSEDLVHWREGEHAISLSEARPSAQVWAPEAIECQGRFYLCYSVGYNDQGHGVQVAFADKPEGPYVHVAPLTDSSIPFAIDGHALCDRTENGDEDSLWFFYAADLLDGERPATSLFVDRVLSPAELAGEERCILRADADWQIYKRGCPMYGDIYDRHTVEDPQSSTVEGSCTYCFPAATG